MRLLKVSSTNSCNYYVIESHRDNGKPVTSVLEKLGNDEYIKAKYGVDDAYAWCRKHLEELKLEEKEKKARENRTMTLILHEGKEKDTEDAVFNVGYLILDKLYHDFGMSNICTEIMVKHPHVKGFNLDTVLRSMLFGRILKPTSKLRLATEVCPQFLEYEEIAVQHIYRAMDLLYEHNDLIQKRLYQYSNQVVERNVHRLYYDCTNFYTEIEMEDSDRTNKNDGLHSKRTLRMYGKSKENRPNPIVQMGLFMDGDGMPLGFTINPGNTNEQITMTPLESKIIENFASTDVVVCTDAGLSSYENRWFNNLTKADLKRSEQSRTGQLHFVTVQSLKSLPEFLRDWALASDGWSYTHKKDGKTIKETGFNLNNINDDNYQEFFNTVFVKERTIAEKGLDQRLIVTFSLKYKEYCKSLRERKVKRAEKLIKNGSYDRNNSNSPKSVIKTTHTTSDGKEATQTKAEIDKDKLVKDAKYDGFYCNATNLFQNEMSAEQITAIAARRWEIEECFRIMKSDLKSRPFYHSTDPRIISHFLTCFLALTLVRALEAKIANHVGPHPRYPDGLFTVSELLRALRQLKVVKVAKGKGYMPSFNSDEVTNKLLEVFELPEFTREVVFKDKMKKIVKKMKNSPDPILGDPP